MNIKLLWKKKKKKKKKKQKNINLRIIAIIFPYTVRGSFSRLSEGNRGQWNNSEQVSVRRLTRLLFSVSLSVDNRFQLMKRTANFDVVSFINSQREYYWVLAHKFYTYKRGKNWDDINKKNMKYYLFISETKKVKKKKMFSKKWLTHKQEYIFFFIYTNVENFCSKLKVKKLFEIKKF